MKEKLKEIHNITEMFNINMNGYYELRHLPYSGGFYEQESSELERILFIRNALNKYITQKKEEK